jgi:predicted RNase H-like HicB family nuclease
MAVAQYVGILDGAGDVWGVRIPDFPGCYGGGATPEDALSDAINALREVAAHYVANDRSVPAPRTMDEVRRDEAAAYDPSRESMVMVPLLLDRARPVRANISIDAGTLEAIDEEAEKRGLTRSSFLASAAVEKIGGRFGGLPAKTGGGRVAGSYKSSTQIKSTITGAWTKRDDKSGRLMDVKTEKSGRYLNVKADPKPKHTRDDRTPVASGSDRKSKSRQR